MLFHDDIKENIYFNFLTIKTKVEIITIRGSAIKNTGKWKSNTLSSQRPEITARPSKPNIRKPMPAYRR